MTGYCHYRSTDSEMKLWDVNTGRCLKTYHGHKNDKNFVGLTVSGNHIVCGMLYKYDLLIVDVIIGINRLRKQLIILLLQGCIQTHTDIPF